MYIFISLNSFLFRLARMEWKGIPVADRVGRAVGRAVGVPCCSSVLPRRGLRTEDELRLKLCRWGGREGVFFFFFLSHY